MFRKAIGVVAIVAMVIGMGACGESKWVDGEAMKQIAVGLEKRFDLRDQQIKERDDDDHDALKKAAQVELDNDGYLRSKPFGTSACRATSWPTLTFSRPRRRR